MSGKQFLKSMMVHAAYGAFGAAALSFGVSSSATAETLSEALAKAYATNPSLQSARASVRASDENLSQALSGYRPSIGASGTVATKKQITISNPDVVQSSVPRTLSLTAKQSLFSGGQTMAAVSSAEHVITAQRARLNGAEQKVLLNAATAFSDVLRDQAVLELNIRNEQVLGRHLEATRDRFNVGEITRTDVHQAEARLAGATANRIQSEGVLAASRANYANVVGEAPVSLEKRSMVLPLPISLDDALSLAEENPAFVAASYDEKAARDGIKGTIGKILPSIDLSGSATRLVETSYAGSWSNTFEAKVTMSVPLYQSGAVHSQVRQARQKAAAARLDLEQTRRDVDEQVRRAWQNVEVTQARIESINTQVLAAETALEGVQREASVGSRTVLDVLDSEQELLDARVNLVKSQRDETVAALSLLSSVGRLTAMDLNLVVDLYDTGRHYRDVRNKWFGTHAK